MPAPLPPERWFPAGVPGLATAWRALPDGTRVRVIVGGDGAGPTLLFVHGWGCSAYTWRHVLPRAVRAGHRVLAVDLPGHGLSDKPDAEARYTRAAMADAIRALAVDAGADGVVLVGHSMGGAIVREVACDAARRPRGLRGMALLAPAGFGRIRRLATGRVLSPDWAVPLLGPALVPRWVVRRSMERTWGPRAGFTEAEVDEYWAGTQSTGFVRASRHLLHHFDWAPPPPAALAPLTDLPVLVLLGTVDRLVVARDTAHALAGRAGVRLEWLDGAGHALQEDSPAATWLVLSHWLAHPDAAGMPAEPELAAG